MLEHHDTANPWSWISAAELLSVAFDLSLKTEIKSHSGSMPENKWQFWVPFSIQKLHLRSSTSLLVLMNHYYTTIPCLKTKKSTSSYLLEELSVALNSTLLPLCLALGATRWWIIPGLPGPAVHSNSVVIAFLNSLYNSPMGLVHCELGGKIVRWCGARIKESILTKLLRNLPGFMVH